MQDRQDGHLVKMHRDDGIYEFVHSIKACRDLSGSQSVPGFKPRPPQSSWAWGHQMQVNGAQKSWPGSRGHVWTGTWLLEPEQAGADSVRAARHGAWRGDTNNSGRRSGSCGPRDGREPGKGVSGEQGRGGGGLGEVGALVSRA